MRVLYIMLAAAATILASSEAATNSDQTQVSKLVSPQAVESISAGRLDEGKRRFLRTQDEGEEERVLNLATLDDLMKVEDLLKAKALGRKADAIKFGAAKNALFARFSNSDLRKNILKKIPEDKNRQWIESLWRGYVWRKILAKENNLDAAAAGRARPSTS
ncbi:hypothetical protein PHYPSEUDO_010063 [Phytophthora pseudosyringae]|uniref:RxLR effector protein n=1 Tax=Phytophthora pseudosyringae TaxID=221518 RepID=A0A8T1VBZ8_9STRA|nr:hypothetical protein PHYPSEUDO_010063 [Phytophthora pseudosyringae]